jgi:hypothetical protein
MNECANGCADLAVGPRSGAEGFTRKCVGAVRPPSRSSFGPEADEARARARETERAEMIERARLTMDAFARPPRRHEPWKKGKALPPDTVVRFMRLIQGRRVAVGARGQLRGDRGRQADRQDELRLRCLQRPSWVGCCQRRPKTGQWRSPRPESGERQMIH